MGTLLRAAGRLGLDEALLNRCLADHTVVEQVERYAEEAVVLGVGATPTFFLGRLDELGRLRVTLRLDGAPSRDQFVRILDGLVGKTDDRP